MNYGVPGLPDTPVNIPIYGYGSFHRRGDRVFRLGLLFRRLTGLINTGEWLLVLLTLLTLGVATYSIENARWIPSQLPLLLVLFLAIISTFILVKLRIPRLAKAACNVGLLIILEFWQTSRLSGGSVFQSLATSPNENSVFFAIFIVVVIWVAGAYSTWLILRKENVWIPAGLGAIILLINLSNLSPDNYIILPVYMAVAFILIGIVRLTQDQNRWSLNGNRYPKRATSYSLVAVTIFVIVAAMIAWFTPVKAVEKLGFDTNGHLISDIQKDWFNIFASVQSKWNTVINEDLKTLSFDAPLDNRATVLFTVTSNQPAYWRIKQYSDYSQQGWSNSSPETGRIIDPGAKTDSGTMQDNVRELTYTVETDSKTDVLLLTGEFVSADIPVRLELHSLASEMDTPDVISVTTPRILQPHQNYSVTVTISTASPEQLMEAGTDYPDWVVPGYLQLPDNLPTRVRTLASTITNNSSNSYDKAIAIQRYLNGLKYNIEAKSPSRLGDETSVFLFEQKEGVCTDFATAMVVMLRSVGIPARLATGYVTGEHNEDTDAFIIRGRNYHAWPEVYFPGYGWIEFEPTPGSNIDTIISQGNSDNPYYDAFPYGTIDSGEGLISNVPTIVTSKPRHNYALPVIGILLLLFAIGSIIWVFGLRAYRNLRLSGDAITVYGKMCRLAAFGGAEPFLTETPLEYCHRLAIAVPSGAQAIHNIANLYAESRFGPRKDLTDNDLVRLQKSWVELYPILFKRRFPWNK
jgi:transglutaminase-like putative cysteine protease